MDRPALPTSIRALRILGVLVYLMYLPNMIGLVGFAFIANAAARPTDNVILFNALNFLYAATVLVGVATMLFYAFSRREHLPIVLKIVAIIPFIGLVWIGIAQGQPWPFIPLLLRVFG